VAFTPFPRNAVVTREQVEAAVKLFGRLINPQDFHLVADSKCMPEFSLASLHQTLGLSSRFLPGNLTGHYDLMLGLMVRITPRFPTSSRTDHKIRAIRRVTLTHICENSCNVLFLLLVVVLWVSYLRDALLE
jgi:hypothetical protein